MSNKALTTAIKDSGGNVNEQAAAIVAALNNENNNITETDDINLGDAVEPGLAGDGGGIWKYLGGWCNCGAPVRCVSMYCLTLNLFLVIIVLVYKPDVNPALTWWAIFLVAILVNIIASSALLYITFKGDRATQGTDLEMGQVPPSASDDPKSESFKTVLTINSKALPGKTLPVKPDVPAIKASTSTTSNIGQTGSDEPANSRASTGFTNLTPKGGKHSSKETDKNKAKDKKKEIKDKKKDKKKHKKKAGSKEKDRDKDKEAPEEDTNFGVVPTNVITGQKEPKAKKKKGNKNKKKK